MELEAFFPGVWDKLTDAQRRALESAASPRRLEAGEQLSGAGASASACSRCAPGGCGPI